MSVFQFPRIRARMTQRQRVNYAWWQTSRNRVVASPGKTAAVGVLQMFLSARLVASRNITSGSISKTSCKSR